ncbi:hypothetical protein C8Q79DRAFT_1011961 [Trametes meyenii]|nr:hypothetical protein C8Q79DRAFT_1011961 [Trametes meyenii]
MPIFNDAHFNRYLSSITLLRPHLSQLVMSPSQPHIMLRHFGPEVEVLFLPLRDLESAAGNVDHDYLSRYTNLRSLTIFLDPYDASKGQWYLLALFLERSIPGGEALCTVAIEFDALEKVAFAVHWKDTPNCKDASEVVHEVKQQIAQSLYDLVNSEKLETRVHAVEKVSARIIL